MVPDMALSSNIDLDITLTSGGSIGHSHQHDPWWQHGPMDINVVSGCSTDHRHMCDLCWSHDPWALPQTSTQSPQVASGSLIHTWLSEAAQAMDISVASGSCVYHLLQHGPWPATWPLGINVASGDGTDQRHPKGPGWNHRPLTSSCPPLKAVKHEDITKASVSSKDHMCPPGSQASSRRGAVAWITGTGMASRGIKDHIGTSRRPVPESKPFLLSGSVVAQSPGCMFGCRVCICASSRLLYTTLPTLLGTDNMST